MEVDLQEDPIPLPRGAVRFPIELITPAGFRAEDPSTWPPIDGRLEYVGGKLLYMPPCGDTQQDVCASLISLLEEWTHGHVGFVAAANEAGMILAGETRGADGALWRKDALGPRTGGFRRVPPVLAVEVAGREEGEEELRRKARWYLEHGVAVVWLVLPEPREVVVVTSQSERRHGNDEKLAPHPDLPGLEPRVERFFRQL